MRTILYGIQVTVVGMVVVFVGLIILVYAITLLRKAIGGKQAKSGHVETPAPAPGEADCAPEAPETPEATTVAVIMAAVAAALEAQTETVAPGGFVVRSIRRVHGAPAWSRAGREEQIYSRL